MVCEVTNTLARMPPYKYPPLIRSMNRAASAHIMPHPVFGNLYTRNSVSLNRSMEKVPSITRLGLINVFTDTSISAMLRYLSVLF